MFHAWDIFGVYIPTRQGVDRGGDWQQAQRTLLQGHSETVSQAPSIEVSFLFHFPKQLLGNELTCCLFSDGLMRVFAQLPLKVLILVVI